MKGKQQVKKRSIPSALGYGLATLTSLFLLSACGAPAIEPVAPIEVRTIETPRPAPIVPTVDQLKLKDVKWIIITPENMNNVFASLSGEAVLFAVTTSGYEAIALNLSDVRAMIQQQQQIIAIYQDSYRR
jgi:hypothetical protein